MPDSFLFLISRCGQDNQALKSFQQQVSLSIFKASVVSLERDSCCTQHSIGLQSDRQVGAARQMVAGSRGPKSVALAQAYTWCTLGNINPVDFVAIIVVIIIANSYYMPGTLLNMSSHCVISFSEKSCFFHFRREKLRAERYSARVTQIVSIHIWPRAPSRV